MWQTRLKSRLGESWENCSALQRQWKTHRCILLWSYLCSCENMQTFARGFVLYCPVEIHFLRIVLVLVFFLFSRLRSEKRLIPSASATQWNWIKVVPLVVFSFSLLAAATAESERGVLTIYRRTNCRDAIISQREERTGVGDADREREREKQIKGEGRQSREAGRERGEDARED